MLLTVSNPAVLSDPRLDLLVRSRYGSPPYSLDPRASQPFAATAELPVLVGYPCYFVPGSRIGQGFSTVTPASHGFGRGGTGVVVREKKLARGDMRRCHEPFFFPGRLDLILKGKSSAPGTSPDYSTLLRHSHHGGRHLTTN